MLFLAMAMFRINIDLVPSLPSTVKLGYCEKAAKFDKISLSNVKISRRFKKKRRMVNVNKFCEIGFPRVALTDSHNMFDGDRARQQPRVSIAPGLFQFSSPGTFGLL